MGDDALGQRQIRRPYMSVLFSDIDPDPTIPALLLSLSQIDRYGDRERERYRVILISNAEESLCAACNICLSLIDPTPTLTYLKALFSVPL